MQNRLQIGINTCRNDDDEDEAQEPTGPNRQEDSKRHGSRGVGGFLAHVNTAVERADRPDRAQPAQHERPARGPRRQVLRLREDEMPIVSAVPGPDRQGDDRRGDENKVHGHEDGLEFPHDFRHDGSQHAVAEKTGEKGSIDGSVGGVPIPVARDHDDGKKHQGEAICGRCQSLDYR